MSAIGFMHITFTRYQDTDRLQCGVSWISIIRNVCPYDGLPLIPPGESNEVGAGMQAMSRAVKAGPSSGLGADSLDNTAARKFSNFHTHFV